MKRVKPISRGGLKQANVTQGTVLNLLEKFLGDLAEQVFGGKEGGIPSD